MNKSTHKTIVIIGGGAAGFFCAANIPHRPGQKVILLEKSNKWLSKVKVSGGGRCNVTHNADSIAAMAKKYPRGGKFVKKTFHHFFVPDTIAWFRQRGVVLKTEADNRMFPVTDESQTIIDCLMQEVQRQGVDLRMQHAVQSVSPAADGGYTIQLQGREALFADVVVIASGGFPKLDMFEWLKPLGHQINPPVPSLFTFNIPKHPITQFMGLSVPDAQVRINGTKLQQSGPLLITHWGLSGPAVLKLSAYSALYLAEQQYQFKIQVNWLNQFNEETLRQHLLEYRQMHPQQKVMNTQGLGLPARLWEYMMQESSIAADMRWGDLPAKDFNRFLKNVAAMEFEVKGKTTFKEEFVTAGGVDLSEVDSNTMESKLQKGIYFAGEILNIDGVTGGFNFQNAWTTGFIAAQSIAAS
ncbi:BaiN/RdsA family NAD(P)/FAD-dependent oxidoreductase [Edaphocola flava]|uniref:NAD(P)/FAD-dependent oxidoreductase n=1 Tax=Edaphocola flava TaxID=2499629 RepID=UPI00100B9FBA|nr:NAD(P)/FAD-dependent oxidoreductase [Edaphocola flava]